MTNCKHGTWMLRCRTCGDLADASELMGEVLEDKIERMTEALIEGLKLNGHAADNSDDRCLILNVLRQHLYPQGPHFNPKPG